MLTKIRLSTSSLDLLDTCDRLFQLERLLQGQRNVYEASHLSRGHAFGKGCQIYLLTGDMDKALYHAWLAYWPVIEEAPKVTMHRTLHALLCAQPALDEIRSKYEVVSFNGIPAAELGVKLIIDAIYYWVGFIDLVLRNKDTNLYVILEIKYTGSWLPVEPMFKNSPQGLAYSVAIDQIVGEKQAEYGVLYFICQDSNKEPKEIRFHIKEWEKTLHERLKWFISIGLKVERIQRMRQLGTFPMVSKSCIRFNRACQHFDTCNMTAGEQERNDEPDPHEGKYQFTYQLEDIIKDHLERGA